jgi:hypothetical protein
MSEGKLRFGDENPSVKKLRELLGVSDFEEVTVVTPQFERPDGKEITFRPEKSAEFFDKLQKAPDDLLIDIGMGRWNDRLLLFPHEWYDCIPEGYIVRDINEEDEPFKHGETDNDIRFGCLAYGFAREPSNPLDTNRVT